MEMDKLGSWIKLEPGLVVDGGNKAMHAVNSGVRFTSKSKRYSTGQIGSDRVGKGDGTVAKMMLKTIDAGIVVFGDPTGFPTSGPYGNQEPDLSKGVSSMLHNNLWGTNVRRSCQARSCSICSYVEPQRSLGVRDSTRRLCCVH